MSNRQDCAFFELGRNDFLNQLVVLLVNVGSGLIHEDDFTVLEESSANAQKLFLTNR